MKTLHIDLGAEWRGGQQQVLLLLRGLRSRGHAAELVALDGAPNVWGIAADTDGIDGSEDNAGAVLAPGDVKQHGRAMELLARHDSYGFFQDRGGLVVTYCDGIGCNASTKGALKMAELGFRTKELIGGLDWWKRDGHPTEKKGSEQFSGNT